MVEYVYNLQKTFNKGIILPVLRAPAEVRCYTPNIQHDRSAKLRLREVLC